MVGDGMGEKICSFRAHRCYTNAYRTFNIIGQVRKILSSQTTLSRMPVCLLTDRLAGSTIKVSCFRNKRALSGNNFLFVVTICFFASFVFHFFFYFLINIANNASTVSSTFLCIFRKNAWICILHSSTFMNLFTNYPLGPVTVHSGVKLLLSRQSLIGRVIFDIFLVGAGRMIGIGRISF